MSKIYNNIEENKSQTDFSGSPKPGRYKDDIQKLMSKMKNLDRS